ncbi:MAG TPA: preprotein translocase subunit SecA, partial [bacterium]|nr:preprotein translocase subunit SecA [bacterium]
MGFWDKIFGDPNEKIIKSLQPIIDKINSLEDGFKKKTDEELKNFSLEMKERLGVLDTNKDFDFKKQQEKLNEILPEAFAAVREASSRILGQRHYDVQLVGGIVLHRGQIAEMKTGEGKTLVATLPLYLNALLGKGVHLVTVNDYLSRVGAGWMAPVYHALGLTTGVIVHDTAFVYDPSVSDENEFDSRLKPFRKVSRKEAYNCDITYGTNNEFGFDYLKDNMVSDLSRMVQRDFYYAIVDEIDSILIDEARTPLIISAPAEDSNDKYARFAELVRNLKENEDYNVDEKMRAATLT